MSTALAIASVTLVLKDLLNDGLIDNDVTGTIGKNVLITALPPDRIETGPATENTQLNLFMYMATPNPGWRNQGQPSVNARGERVSNPPLALDLHYLLTAYGSEELHHEILLGYGMQLLHETPVLAREAIKKSLPSPTSAGGAALPQNLRALSDSELADQVEQIKITPQVLNTEEISKLWAAFGAKYRSTAAYKVTVVLIESRKQTKPSLPVQNPRFYANTTRIPAIQKISSQSAPGALVADMQHILAGYTLVLNGTQLAGEIVSVNIDGTEITPAPEAITDSQITFSLPAGLEAGAHGVQVVHKTMMGSPPLPHQGASSNMQVFVLSPHIETIQAEAVTNGDNGLKWGSVKINVQPAITASQRVVLLLNELNTGDAAPLSYSFWMPAGPAVSSVNITIPVAGVKAGTYLARVRVNGAESPLQRNAAQAFVSPQLTIP